MDVGLAWAGFRHVFFAEIDPYCRAVLAARFPGVHIYDDVRDVAANGNGVGFTEPSGIARSVNHGPEHGSGHGPCGSRLDLLCGGFPCQDLSVAGKRAGLAGARSGLFHEFMRISDALRPRAVLVENVQGLYSSDGGRDFGVVLDALAERGYLVTWRTLDAQHFGVPQRRLRVFVCAVLDGDPGAERIGEVLALQEGSGGDSPTSDPAWPLSAASARAGATGGGGVDAVNVERERESFLPSPPSGRRAAEAQPETSARTSCGRDSHSDLRRAVRSGHGPQRSWPRLAVGSERERERERVVSALTSSIQNGADVRNAQAGHLIVEPTSGEASE